MARRTDSEISYSACPCPVMGARRDDSHIFFSIKPLTGDFCFGVRKQGCFYSGFFLFFPEKVVSVWLGLNLVVLFFFSRIPMFMVESYYLMTRFACVQFLCSFMRIVR